MISGMGDIPTVLLQRGVAGLERVESVLGRGMHVTPPWDVWGCGAKREAIIAT